MTRSTMRSRGFTLIELMIVVSIIGVLAVVAVNSFKRAGSRARSAEVYGMLGEIRAKEEAYRAENSIYCTTAGTACATAATTASETNWYPALLATGEPVAKTISSAVWPAAWTQLGLNPGKSALYCGYVAVAGLGSGPPANPYTAGPRGAALLVTQPTGVWWYATATCDMNGNSTTNTIYTTAYNTTAVVVANEGF